MKNRQSQHMPSISADPINKKKLFVFWTGCFLFYFVIMSCAPYSYDDYEFASLDFSSAREFILYCLTYGNGRLLGNISGVFSNQVPIFGSFYKAFIISTTIILIPEILGIRSKFTYAASFLLTTAIDPSLFAQVFTWTSGFANYVPPVFLMLASLFLIQKYPVDSGKPAVKLLLCATLFVLGFSAQLFIEHSSIINILLAGIILLKSATKPGKPRLIPAAVLLTATLSGLVLMFWIPAHYIASANNHTAGYRSVQIGSLSVFAFNCVRNALRLTNHYLGLCGLPLCAGSALTVYLTRMQRSEKVNRFLYAMSGFSGIYILVCSLLDSEGWYAEPAIVHHALAMTAVLSSLAAWLLALVKMEDELLRNRLFVLLGLGVFSMLPLLVVTPVHIRVLYHSQVFIVIAFLLILCRWAEAWPSGWMARAACALAACALALIITLVPVFLSIRSMTQARHAYTIAQMEQGAQTIEFFRVPYNYVHDATDAANGDYYYHNQRRDIQFNYISYDQWMNDHWNSIP